MTEASSLSAAPTEPARIKKFRLELVKAIPRFPNNRASLAHMQQKPLGTVLIDYLNWRSRYVGVRPRAVTVEPVAEADARWSVLSMEITAFLEKVRKGEDLTSHLSIQPHTRGYAPAARLPGATSEDRWSDKDPLLAGMGYHHFHLGTTVEAAGHVARTDDLIFAQVARETFTVIAIFDHNVFELGSTERLRLWEVHDEVSLRGVPPGSVVLSAPIMTSGHALHVVQYAGHCARIIVKTDAEIDGKARLGDRFVAAGFTAPEKPRFEWSFHHLDLGLFEKSSRTVIWQARGWN